MHTFESESMGGRHRRRHSPEFKQAVVAECRRPGVSLASVALRHGLNATLLRKWVVDAGGKSAPARRAAAVVPATPQTVPTFVPIPLAAPASTDISIELQRGGTSVKITWPTGAAAECAAWLRDWLR